MPIRKREPSPLTSAKIVALVDHEDNNVPSGQSEIGFWRRPADNSPVDKASLGASSMCGCTVVVISSPDAMIMVYTLSMRARTEWAVNDLGG